ncbi:carboxypeptidase regulatory-like domain-containing protein [bacterium]|nr:carboxypeptidase regulatory-like domain-containing protein [bacterium]
MLRSASILLALLLCMTTLSWAQEPPRNLQAHVDVNGYVTLNWEAPVGGLTPSSYWIYRGDEDDTVPLKIKAQIYSATAVQWTDFEVEISKSYKYLVVAKYSSGQTGYSSIVAIEVLPPRSGLKIVSTAPSTALVGNEWVYQIRLANPARQNIEYKLHNAPPGMDPRNLADGTTYISWVPSSVGRFKVTLEAKDWYTNEQDYQEFFVTTAEHAGTIQGFVRTINSKPLANAQVTVKQWSSDLDYTTVTDADGNFTLDYVEAGKTSAHATSPHPDYKTQWYSNQVSIDNAARLPLAEGDTIRYEFYLLPKPGTRTGVIGRVYDDRGVELENAKVSIYAKENFIHIGDQPGTNTLDVGAEKEWRQSLVDTVVYTDFTGKYILSLPVGEDYYAVVEKPGYLNAFSGNVTNAMLAKAFHVGSTGASRTFNLPEAAPTVNTIYGKVSSKNTGVSKQATIVLIDSEMKRGAGGGHTYRKYKSVVTDSNGVYRFDDLEESPPSALLAIPMDTRLAPQYYHSNNGRLNFVESEEITPLGTMQDFDFELQEVVRNGIGVFYGQVILRVGSERIPVPGTLVFAQDNNTGDIMGFAVSDSLGWYSLPGLGQGDYLLFADNPQYSFHEVYSPAKPTESMPVEMAYTSPTSPSRTTLVNFYIDDERTTVDVDPFARPTSVELYQNYPNPFNPSTTIRFEVPQRQHVVLRVINALGEVVATLADESVNPGAHVIEFNAADLSSGVYFYQLQTEGALLTKRMTLTK